MDIGGSPGINPQFAKLSAITPRYSQNKTGKIIWADDFSFGDFDVLGFVSGAAAETQQGGITERSLYRSLSGSRASLHVSNPVSSSIQTGARPFNTNFKNLTQVGVEFWWTYNAAMQGATGGPNYDFFLQWWDGTNRWNGGLLYSPVQGSYYITTPVASTFVSGAAVTGGFQLPAFDDATALYGTEVWNYNKHIVNVKTGTFVSVENRDGIFNVGGKAVLSTADNSVPAGMMRAGVACNTGASTPLMEVYVGMIVVTDES